MHREDTCIFCVPLGGYQLAVDLIQKRNCESVDIKRIIQYNVSILLKPIR